MPFFLIFYRIAVYYECSAPLKTPILQLKTEVITQIKRILTLISECNGELVNLFSGNKTHSEDSQGSSENLVKAAWPFLVFFLPSLPNINNSVKFYLK